MTAGATGKTGKTVAAVRALEDYHAHGCWEKFREHLIDHLANGYVFSTPSVFALFKAVQLDDDRIAWYVTYCTAPLADLLAHIPYPLPYIAFRRYRHGRETLRVYPFDRFVRCAAHFAPTIHHSRITLL